MTTESREEPRTDLPPRQVTFHFTHIELTDVEGSTRLWPSLRDAFPTDGLAAELT